MDDPLVVRGFQRFRDLRNDTQRLLNREATTAETIGQRLACHKFHDQVVGTDVVDGADIGMVERCDRARLTLEPVAEARRRYLDGDIAVQARVRGAVHLAHAAFPDGFENLVRAEERPRCERHLVAEILRDLDRLPTSGLSFGFGDLVEQCMKPGEQPGVWEPHRLKEVLGGRPDRSWRMAGRCVASARMEPMRALTRCGPGVSSSLVRCPRNEGLAASSRGRGFAPVHEADAVRRK